jgi:hypothetical protein
MRSIFLAIAILASTPAMAADAPSGNTAAAAFKTGDWMRDVDGRRIGKVSNVNQDGSAKVIFESRIITVPGPTLNMVDGKLATSLSVRELRDLR